MSLAKLMGAAAILLLALPACADEAASAHAEPAPLLLDTRPLGRAASGAGDAVGRLLAGALDLIGVRYRRGGTSPDTGFDCSGFVDHVFRETLGLILPRSAREIAGSGEKVHREDLRPGDLVFFNTMRRTFSHVGIYLGEHQFVHAPAAGGEVRIEDMHSRYWAGRFSGARRVEAD